TDVTRPPWPRTPAPPSTRVSHAVSIASRWTTGSTEVFTAISRSRIRFPYIVLQAVAERISRKRERSPPSGHCASARASRTIGAMANGKVQFTLDDADVLTIVLDDPGKRNAPSLALPDDLIGALDEARDDEATRCIVVSLTLPYDALDCLQSQLTLVLATQDAKEGVQAFL